MVNNLIQRGCQIAYLRIHVERTIGRIKNYAILKGTFPNTMIRLANQIVSVCAWLTNFQPALIPLPSDLSVEEEVGSYFETIEDSDYDADSELMMIVLSHQKIHKRLLHVPLTCSLNLHSHYSASLSPSLSLPTPSLPLAPSFLTLLATFCKFLFL